MRRTHVQRQQELSQVPRRIPNFPHPVISLPLTSLLSQPRPNVEDDMISNPSADDVDRPLTRPVRPSSPPESSRPALHDPALAHLHTPSSNVIPTPFQIPLPIPIQTPVPKRTLADALNLYA
jgi:hypothetical protein